MSLYADYTAIVVSDSDSNILERKLEAVMQQVSSWYQKNKLSVNLQKSKFMLMGTQPCLAQMQEVTVTLGDTALERVNSYKYLGIQLDSHLEFSDHVNYVRKRLPKYNC